MLKRLLHVPVALFRSIRIELAWHRDAAAAWRTRERLGCKSNHEIDELLIVDELHRHGRTP